MILSRAFFKLSMVAGTIFTGLTAVGPAHAAAVPYYFDGNCVDCAIQAGTDTFPVAAVLLVSDYIEGTPLDDSHFMSFVYSGSNLLDPYLVSINSEPDGGPVLPWTHQFYSMTGNLTTGGEQTLALRFGDGLEFTLDAQGNWFTCGGKDGNYNAVTCSGQSNNDYGTGQFLSRPPIPEPATYALFALGLAGLVVMRRQRSSQR